ncbi:odorant receptor 49a-like [Battus philenor]|uniref:odorant receptor 49a-like n=1 Tax=Battus philenor TaxID=42288 RepID=UPI0035CF79EA
MFKKLKAFINKEYFDSSEGLVDPYKYHFICYHILRFFQVLDNEPKSKCKSFIIFILLICTTTAICMMGVSAYHGFMTSDLIRLTESGCYVIILFYQLLMFLCIVVNLPQYRVLLTTLRDDFNYICTGGAKYRERYFKNQLKIWKMCLSAVVFTSSIGVGMVMTTSLCLLWYVIIHEPGDGRKRPMLFPFWFFDIDFSATPHYEMFFTFSNFCVFDYALSYVFMIQTQIFWVGQITTKADLVIWYIQDLMEGLKLPTNIEENIQYKSEIIARMRKIVKEHVTMYRLVENFSKVYKKLLMFEQKAAAPVVCLTAYSSAEKLSVGEINGLTMFLCIGTIIEVFIPSYLGTVLDVKLTSVAEICLDIPFWKTGHFMRPYIILMIQRSLRKLKLNAPGFEDVSVQTFSNKMATAYSFFNMLRKLNV